MFKRSTSRGQSQPYLGHLFHSQLPSLSTHMPGDDYQQIMKLGISSKLQCQLQKAIPLVPNLKKQPIFTHEQLKFAAFQLLAPQISTEQLEPTLEVGQAMLEKFIINQPKEFVQVVFSTSPLIVGGFNDVYASPLVLRSVFEEMLSKPAENSPAEISRIIAAGIGRVGFSLSRVGTTQDVFAPVGKASSAPLLAALSGVTVNKKLMAEAMSQGAKSDISASILVLAALRDKPSNYADLQRDPLVHNLVTVPNLMNKSRHPLYKDEIDLRYVFDAMSTGELKELTKCLLAPSLGIPANAITYSCR